MAEKYAEFEQDAQKAVQGNKAAGARSRKATLELEKILSFYTYQPWKIIIDLYLLKTYTHSFE